MAKVNCAFDKMVSTVDLIENPRNPNTHPKRQVELLARIIARQGWRHPITVSNRSGFVVHGHGRLLAARSLGEPEVPVDFQDYENEAQEWEDLLADNRIAELAELDDAVAVELLNELEEINAEVELTGFTDAEINKMLEKVDKKEKQDKPEIEFSEELHESSNYVVLYFNNDIDWLQAQTLFDLKTVKALDSKPGFEKMGIGRVLNGVEVINKLLG
jgi:ParB-like chromosome segregation protein Spo0J